MVDGIVVWQMLELGRVSSQLFDLLVEYLSTISPAIAHPGHDPHLLQVY